MKKLIFLFVLMLVFSCKKYIDKPKNLVSEGTMSEILADLAINDQATFMFQNTNLESGTRFVLKTHNVKPDDFVASFKYYVVEQKMSGIADDAQKILLKKDPKADQYVKDKIKKNLSPPVLSN
ncbi:MULTISPECIES: DUF4296 domain-containing protein [Chryseobacterium]|uniref:DUF4296 domain-containing protein n=1 Tax=Chryseobacterium TaxID=59732 RepID=UPI0015530D66|nr:MULTISPECIES: DUF4296 domain-containing protein [unclassified Chryseobacterium]MDC8106252.1 DUF4296 domain-containing protein [Chryseobacterium sp. B21-037]MDQ1804756.1 DUF4296 domain-containing protein [Chryseobacterium sp. CKR4-1]